MPALPPHRSRALARPDPVTITVDGRPVAAHPGESLATALLAAGIRTLRASPRAGGPRGAFCFMGVCQECVVRVDGAIRQACLERVRAGMQVTLGGTLGGKPDAPHG